MDDLPKPRQSQNLLAVVLWLVSFGLGLQAIHDLTQLLALFQVSLGGSLNQARFSMMGWVLVLTLIFLVFLIASTEYHIKRVGTLKSWRLFGWTIAVELGIILLYNLL